MTDLDNAHAHAATIAAAYLSHNALPPDAAAVFVGLVYNVVLGATNPEPVAEPVKLKPAVPIHRSVTPDYIVCLEDGKKLKMLKRHIKTSYNLTPEQYRERWNLGADYPMVAPNYAKQRSKLAKQIGLGTAPRRITRKAA